MFTVQGIFIAIWLIGGILVFIGSFKNGWIWILPPIALALTMTWGFWYDSKEDTEYGFTTVVVIFSINILADLIFLGRLALRKPVELSGSSSRSAVMNRLISIVLSVVFIGLFIKIAL